MIRIHDLCAILTCFAYRDEYIAELEGMLATARTCHPTWPVVIGRGPVRSRNGAALEVETAWGCFEWTLPVLLDLNGSADDWRKITLMKGWWLAQIWRLWSPRSDSGRCRIVWLDADARLNSPLDFEVDPDAEVVAGPWWKGDRGLPDSKSGECETITTGLLLLQGRANGSVSRLLQEWERLCLRRIADLPLPTVEWLDGDQEALTEVLTQFSPDHPELVIPKLEYSRYCREYPLDRVSDSTAVVDQWMMSKKMKLPETRNNQWPPPENQRRSKFDLNVHPRTIERAIVKKTPR